MVGVLTILFIDLNALARSLPIPSGDVPELTPFIKVVGLVQPAVLLAVAAFIGTALTPAVGLHAPSFEAGVEGRPIWPSLAPQIVPGILGGIAGGVLIASIARAALPFLPEGASQTISKFVGVMPLATRIGYGGITEEVLLRWGFMTLAAWAVWRLLQRAAEAPTAPVFVAAISVSSLLFGIGHLPVAFLLFGQLNAALLFFVIAANSAFGFIAGFLFWRKGLESAIIAHVITHLVLFAAGLLGAYF
jgi:hypothetical protein